MIKVLLDNKKKLELSITGTGSSFISTNCGEKIICYDQEFGNITIENISSDTIIIKDLQINNIEFVGGSPKRLIFENCKIFRLDEKTSKEKKCLLIGIKAKNTDIVIDRFNSDLVYIQGKRILYYRGELKYPIKQIGSFWVYYLEN